MANGKQGVGSAWDSGLEALEATCQLLLSTIEEADGMSELGETESLRLQMAMDRMSKLMTTLSNILKKMSDASLSMAKNLH